MNYLPASSGVATAPLPARTKTVRERLWAQLVDAQRWSRLRLATGSTVHLLARKVTRFDAQDYDPAAMI